MATKCSKCSREAVVLLPYMRANMCKRHFCEFFEARVKRTIREFRLVKRKERIGIALSGGKDSTVTLAMMKKISESMPLELIALSVEEGIGGYRNELLENARKACKMFGVEHVVVSFEKDHGVMMDEIARKKNRQTTCSYCGVLRRWSLNKAARELGLDRIAVGHNLDDVAQTVFLNLLRNEPGRLARYGATGGFEDENFVPRIRPLFRTPEREIALYAVLEKLPLRFGPCPYAQEAMRNHVRAFLNDMEEKYPGTKYRILNSFLSMRNGIGEFAGNGRPGRCSRCGEPSSLRICKRCEMLSSLGVG